MAKMARSEKLTTPKFRVSYPAVFEPRGFEGQPAKYSVVMLFDMTDPEVAKGIEEMKKEAMKVLVEQWGNDKTKWPTGLKTPFRRGDEPEKVGKDGYGENIIFVNASSGKMRPGLVDQKCKPIIDPNDFYGGCYAMATGNFFAYDKAGNRGISFGLGNIQKHSDGEPFSGRTKAEDDFSAITPPAGVAGSAGESGVGDDLTGIM